MINDRSALCCALALLLSGCTTPGAVFFTKTSLSIVDIDSTPPEATLAFHRIEGFIGPRNKDGDVPPVVAHIETNRDMFSPRIKQTYATGPAAEGLFRPIDCPACTQQPQQQIGGEKAAGNSTVPPVLFATSTSFGLRVGLTSGGIDGLTLGFRRKELSVIPELAKDASGNFIYPSLLAAVHLGGGRPQAGATPEFEACQAFATGSAARALASGIRDGSLQDFACGSASVKADLVQEYRGSELRQRAEVSRVLNCYVTLPQSSRSSVWSDAQRHGLFADATSGDQDRMIAESKTALDSMLAARQKASELQKEEERATALARLDGEYSTRMLIRTSGQLDKNELRGSALREQLLRSHREFVCAQVSR